MAKRRGPYAAGSPRLKKLAAKPGFKIRLKQDVVEFLKIGGQYHGVAFQTYMQWLLERALLEEIHYYGWEALRPVTFERQQSRKADERHEFLHLNKIARRRERKANRENPLNDTTSP
jgi:hypothetical protein